MQQNQQGTQGYILQDYTQKAPFTSFLPGLAGVKGIPIWAFYTNRGQGICSFGIESKHHPIMEFDPAYLAYEQVAIKGFRTFLRIDGQYVEPFNTDDDDAQTHMQIEENLLHLHMQHAKLPFSVDVTYFVMPNDSYGALVRRVRIKNTGKQAFDLEGLDGLPRLIPYGIDNGGYKDLGNLLRSWSQVSNLDGEVPFYHLRSTTEDSSVVGSVADGIFALSTVNGTLTAPIYDSWGVFGEQHSLDRPRIFRKQGLAGVKAHVQNFYNKFPCALTPFSARLKAGEALEIDTIIGHAASVEWLNQATGRISAPGYLDEKQLQAQGLTDALLKDVTTKTASPMFDGYIRQCYLDNLLRGGYPLQFEAGGKQAVLHLFSRKHGDPERDYNFFSTAAQPYSQGNGNFRDVCQNRRSDVLLHPFTGVHNIRTFMDLIQADGYNPLEVRGMALRIPAGRKAGLAKLLAGVDKDAAQQLKALCAGAFTLGQLALTVGVESPLIQQVLALAEPEVTAAFREGHWADHWIYLLDLVENALKILPDQREQILFGDESYRFFNSPMRVRARSEKYILDGGQPRQYHSVALDEKKKELGWGKDDCRYLATAQGELVQASLYAKLFMLASIKFATLDSAGMGIEMEADKPGWNDAMNGVPGLFGSSMGETLELKRLLGFLKNAAKKDQQVSLPQEFAQLLTGLQKLLHRREGGELDAFGYWDGVATAREQYREAVRISVSGEKESYCALSLGEVCERMLAVLEQGIARALTLGDGLIPTFFTFTPTEYEAVTDQDGQPVLSEFGLPLITVKAFEPLALPTFLEAPVKQLTLTRDVQQAQALHEKVRTSNLFDAKLGMYKTCVPLDDQPMSIGRIRAFTAGWQERESIFLHMHYKYLLAMLDAGLYKTFFEEMPSTWLPFRNADRYGRSPLENCSFLASSVNPDPSLHGRGFVARLSGSTTEVLSMWAHMMVGKDWFDYRDAQLSFRFAPVLAGWLFDDAGSLGFKLLSDCEVTYLNPRKVDTFGEGAAKVVSISLTHEGQQVQLEGDTLPDVWARRLRDGQLKAITVTLA